MFLFKKILSISTVFLLLVCFAATAMGAGAASLLKLCAYVSEDEVHVTIETNTALNFGGVSGTIEYDRNAFSLENCKNGVLDAFINAKNGYFIADTAYDLDVKKGEALITFIFAKKSGYNPSKTYKFTCKPDEVYNFDLEEYPETAKNPLTVTLKGDTSSVTPSPTKTPKPTSAPTARPSNGAANPTAAPTSGSTTAPVGTSETAPSLTEAAASDNPVSGGSDGSTHSVIYKDDDGETILIENIPDGETLSEPDLPEGCLTWVSDGTPVDFSEPVHGDMVITASKDDSTVELTVSLSAEGIPADEKFLLTISYENGGDDEQFELKSGDSKHLTVHEGRQYTITLALKDGQSASAKLVRGAQKASFEDENGFLTVTSTAVNGKNFVVITVSDNQQAVENTNVGKTVQSTNNANADSTENNKSTDSANGGSILPYIVIPAAAVLIGAAAFAIIRRRGANNNK